MAFVLCPGYFENLEGRPLRNGDQVLVQWPDGSISKETVVFMIEDMGYGKLEYFGVYTYQRGTKVAVNIQQNGFLIERVQP